MSLQLVISISHWWLCRTSAALRTTNSSGPGNVLAASTTQVMRRLATRADGRGVQVGLDEKMTTQAMNRTHFR